MADQFSQFGGRKIDSESPAVAPGSQRPDPFAQFGGSVTAPSQENPFEQFGGVKFSSPERTVTGSEFADPNQVVQIARKYDVSPEELLALAPYYGLKVAPSEKEGLAEDIVEAAKYTAGAAGRIALSIPQFLYKKTQAEPMRKAIDEVRELGRKQQGYTELAAEAITGGLAKAPATALGRVTQAGAVGGTVGVAESEEGRELESGAIGVGAGVTLGGLLEGVSRLLGPRTPRVEKQAVENYISNNKVELDRGTREILSNRAASESDLDSAIMRSGEITPEKAQRIVDEQLDPEAVRKYLDQGTEEGRLFHRKVVRNRPDEIRDLGTDRAHINQLAEDIVEQRAIRFANSLGDTDASNLEMARDAIRKYGSRQGDEALQNRYKLFTEEQAALDYIGRNAVRQSRGDSAADKALNLMSDAQFVLRDIDDRFGTAIEPIHREMNRRYNRFTFARREAQDELDKIFTANSRIDKELTSGTRVYNALDSGNTSALSSEELKAYNQFRNYFDNWLEYANNISRSGEKGITPLAIPKRANYVPHILRNTEELIQSFQQLAKQAIDDSSSILGREVTDLASLSPRDLRAVQTQSQRMQQLVEGTKLLSGKSVQSGADLLSSIRDTFFTSPGRRNMESRARALMERTAEIPLWMRETNLYKLADNWSRNTLRHLYLREPIDQMASMARRLDKAGGDLEASYVNRLLADIQGVRKGTLAAFTRDKKIDYLAKLDKIEGTTALGRGTAEIAKALPYIFSDISKQVYPNLLGLSPRALIMNATQVLAKTAPELGGKYGYTTVARGTAHALLNMPTQIRRVVNMGFQPAEYVSKYRRIVADGIRRSSLYSIPSEIVQKAGDAAMYLYTKMDILNRAISLSTADMMAADLARGSASAMRAVKKLPRTVQSQISRAKSTEETAEIIASHLNASTQYNYNRASMSEYGRTMGPLFSVFSKWPTATIGEVIYELRAKGKLGGTMRNVEKYLAPLVLFQLVDIAMFGYDPDKPWAENQENKSDSMKKILGVSGLSQSAPLGSIKGILEGDFFTPPAVDAVMKGIVIPAINGEPNKLVKGVDSAIQNFTPGSVFVRFLTDDLVTLGTGERPEGSTFIERSISGARELGR